MCRPLCALSQVKPARKTISLYWSQNPAAWMCVKCKPHPMPVDALPCMPSQLYNVRVPEQGAWEWDQIHMLLEFWKFAFEYVSIWWLFLTYTVCCIKVHTLILYIYTVIITMATITMTTSYLGVNMEARGGGVSMSPLLCTSSSSLCFTDGSLPPDNSE